MNWNAIIYFALSGIHVAIASQGTEYASMCWGVAVFMFGLGISATIDRQSELKRENEDLIKCIDELLDTAELHGKN